MCSAVVVTPLKSITGGQFKLKKLKDEGFRQPLVGGCQMYPLGSSSLISHRQKMRCIDKAFLNVLKCHSNNLHKKFWALWNRTEYKHGQGNVTAIFIILRNSFSSVNGQTVFCRPFIKLPTPTTDDKIN